MPASWKGRKHFWPATGSDLLAKSYLLHPIIYNLMAPGCGTPSPGWSQSRVKLIGLGVGRVQTIRLLQTSTPPVWCADWVHSPWHLLQQSARSWFGHRQAASQTVGLWENYWAPMFLCDSGHNNATLVPRLFLKLTAMQVAEQQKLLGEVTFEQGWVMTFMGSRHFCFWDSFLH